MAITLEGDNYLFGKLGFAPRPGLDLDAGIRLMRTAPESRWPSIMAQQNQYSNPSAFIRAWMPVMSQMVWNRADAAFAPFGPGWGVQPTDYSNLFAQTNPFMEKQQV